MKMRIENLEIVVLTLVLGALFISTGAALWSLYSYAIIWPTPILVP